MLYFLPQYINIIGLAGSDKMAGYWPRSLFAFFHKNAKRERGQYPAILTELAWSIKDLLYCKKNTEKLIFVLYRKPVTVYASFGFLVPSRQRNHRKSFNCHGNYFAKETFVKPLG